MISAVRLSFDVKTFNDSPVELNEDFMLEQALGQAKIDLANYIEEKAKSLGGISDIAELIRPADVTFLSHLWVRGACKHLIAVYQQTECDVLRAAPRTLLNLPKISKRDLGQ